MNVIAPEPHTATPSALAPLEGIVIREATPADNDALLALTRATPMAGSIALRIDRDPNFFALLHARGEPVVFVATHAGELIGSISAAVFPAYIQGVPELIAHVGDLKVHPAFTGKRLAIRLAIALEAHLRACRIDLTFNLVADGNQRVITINQGRHGTPGHTPFGAFIVRELLPIPFLRRDRNYTIAEATPADHVAITALRDGFARHRIFARIPPAEWPASQDQVLVARHCGQPVATLTLADTSQLRRNVLIGVTPTLRAALALLRLVPGVRVPGIGQPVQMLYARHLGCDPAHIAALRALTQHARTLAFASRAHFLSIGLHQQDPLLAAFIRMPGFTFTSRLSVSSLVSPDRVATLSRTIPFEDFALV